MANKHILITGGTGLIGKKLTDALLKKGYEVSHLGRSPKADDKVKTWHWDVEKQIIDPACIDGVNTIVHLAGAGITEKPWTKSRKKELVDSRVKSIGLLYDLLKSKKNEVNTFISASAIGYYSDRDDELMTEESTPSNDFLANCCIEWEAAADVGAFMGLRVVKLRTGVVLSKDGGALPVMAKPITLNVGSPIGNGRQWVPWIHWQDTVDMYIFAIEQNELSGVFNMVAPVPVTNEQLTKAIAKQLHKHLWAPKVPAIFLKILLGEMSTVVLGSTRVSAEKIEQEGFIFKFPGITDALKDIYSE